MYKAAVDLGLDSEISEVLSSFLPPNQQARWVKGVAGVILTQTLVGDTSDKYQFWLLMCKCLNTK